MISLLELFLLWLLTIMINLLTNSNFIESIETNHLWGLINHTQVRAIEQYDKVAHRKAQNFPKNARRV